MEEKQPLRFFGEGSLWEDLGVLAVLRKLRARSWMLVVVPLLWLVISNMIFAMSPKIYSGTLEVVPASVSRSGTSTAATGGIGGSLLAGFFGTGSSDTIFATYLESWTATWFAADLAKNNAIMRKLYPDQWDDQSKAWREPNAGPLHGITSLIEMSFGARPQPWKAPDAEDALAYLRSHVKISNVRGEVIAEVSIDDVDPAVVRDMLVFGNAEIESALRRKFQQRSDDNIAYLEKKLLDVGVADYRDAIIRELSDQEKMRMLAYGNNDFAAQALGIFVGPTPVRPRASSILAISLILSLVIYVLLVLVADWLNWPLDIWRLRSELRALSGRLSGLR